MAGAFKLWKPEELPQQKYLVVGHGKILWKGEMVEYTSLSYMKDRMEKVIHVALPFPTHIGLRVQVRYLEKITRITVTPWKQKSSVMTYEEPILGEALVWTRYLRYNIARGECRLVRVDGKKIARH